VQADVRANIAEHLRLAELAAAAGSQVVVFPELSLTGYEIALADALAFDLDDARLTPLRAAASSHAIHIVAGAPIRSEARLYIGALVFCPGGATELYTKQGRGRVDR
jgi:predicted amidohydrolase